MWTVGLTGLGLATAKVLRMGFIFLLWSHLWIHYFIPFNFTFNVFADQDRFLTLISNRRCALRLYSQEYGFQIAFFLGPSNTGKGTMYPVS